MKQDVSKLASLVEAFAFDEAFTKWAQENLLGQHLQSNVEAALPGVSQIAAPIIGIAEMMGRKPGLGGEKPWSMWKALQKRHETELE